MLAAGLAPLRAAAQSADQLPATPVGADAAAASLVDQPAARPVPPTTKPAAAPDVFFLPDASGNLRRVLGYSYEEFFQSWRARQAQQDEARQPSFTIATLTAAANAEGDSASTRIVLEVDLQSDQWVEVPLQLGTLIIEDWNISGDGARDFLLFDAKRQGFVAWLQGKPGNRRTITLNGKLVVQRNGDSRQLEVELPAAAASHVDVTASSQVEIESPKLVVHSTVTADDGSYTSQIEGAKGRLAVRWGPRVVDEFDRAATLSAAIDESIAVEPGRLTYDALVQLRSFGEPLDRVRIRLPRGATAASLPAGAGYEILPIVSSRRDETGALVEVRFDQPSTAPPAVRIVAEQSGDAAMPLQAAPFEVVDAFRQRSQLAVRVSELIHVGFQPEGRIEQVDASELPESLRSPAPVAAFVGASADWRLSIQTQPRQRKVRATPSYAMNLGSQGATLEVTLDYQFLGGRTFDLRVDLRGWELSEQPIESGGVVDQAEQHVTPDDTLIMPLKESDLQQARVRFVLRREAGLGLHDMPLPALIDAYSLPGTLSISCEEAWRASVQVENSSGIAAAEASPASPASLPAATSSAAPARRDAAVRRYQTFLPRPRVAVDVSEREQSIAVASIVDVKVADDSLQIDQKLQYDVSYQPTSELSAIVATDLLANGGLELLLDGKPLSSANVEILPLEGAASGASAGHLRLAVRLPRPSVGRFVLQIRSSYSLDELQLAGRAKAAFPLATTSPAATSRAKFVSAPGEARAALWVSEPGEAWRETPPESTGVGADEQPSIFEARASKPVGELALRLQPPKGAEPLALRAEATWIQSWIVGGQRQDRYVFRFRTSSPQVQLHLPGDFAERPLETILDGQVIAVDRTKDLLSVALPQGEQGAQSHTLELRRLVPQRLSATGGLGASFPQLEHVQGSAPLYWQLIVPRDIAVVTTPEGMNGEYQLGWREWNWGRQPTLGQADLEKWTEATTAPSLPASTNEYLYSAFDSPEAVSVRTVRRAWLIVAAGAVALAVGLVALYTNLGRTAGFWLAAIIAAAASLAAYPEAAVLLVQSIFLGAAFTIVSLATRWFLADVRIRRPSPLGPASSIASLTATQPWRPDRQEESAVAAASGSTRRLNETSP